MLFKFCTLILKSLGRSKVRTIVTGLGITVLVCVYAVVSTVVWTVTASMHSQGSESRLICTERWVAPSQLPPRCIPELANQKGVADWTTWNLFACFFDNSGRYDRMGVGIATRAENLATMIADGDQIDPVAIKHLVQRKDGAIVSSAIMRNMKWRIGQEIVVYGTKYPRTRVPLTIVGELPAGQLANFYFRQDYLQNIEPGRVIVNAVVLKMRDAKDADKVATAINEQYAQRQPAVKVETESASVTRFAARAKSILSLIQLVVWVLLIDMAIILSNSISISVRERRVEMAVLKVLGFQPLHIMTMVIGEAMFIGALSGVFGTGLVYLISTLTLHGLMPVTIATRFLIQFPVSVTAVGHGLMLGMLVGLTGSFFPALGAQKVKVSDVFARIA